MSHLCFNHKLSIILEADDLTNISRTLADAGEETVNRREMLRRGAGAVAAGGLGSASKAAAASKPLFDILRANPDLWRSLMIALTSSGTANSLLGTRRQLERRGQNTPITFSTHLIKHNLEQLTNSWIPQLMQRAKDIGLTDTTDINAWGKNRGRGMYDAKNEIHDDLIVTAREALSYLTTDQLKVLSKSVPDLKDKVTNMIADSYRHRQYDSTLKPESGYIMLDPYQATYQLAQKHFDIVGSDTKLVKALGIDGNDIIHKWYDELIERAEFFNSDSFYAMYQNAVDNNEPYKDSFRAMGETAGDIKSKINPSDFANYLQELDIKFDPTLLNNLSDKLKTLAKEFGSKFRLRIYNDKLKQMAKEKSDHKQYQYDLMRWEGEGGALGPTNESKFARRLSRILAKA